MSKAIALSLLLALCLAGCGGGEGWTASFPDSAAGVNPGCGIIGCGWNRAKSMEPIAFCDARAGCWA